MANFHGRWSIKAPYLTAALASILALLTVACPAALFAQNANYDVLIRGAKIVDGTGNPSFSGDVAIKDGQIAAVGYLRNAMAKRVIDANGLVAAPGFIDLHTHSDYTLLADGNAESKVRQGVTMDVIGEGESVAPRDGMKPEKLDPNDPQKQGLTVDWTNFTGYFDRIMRQGISINLASYAGDQQIRHAAIGYDTGPATPAQLELMKKLMARSMEEGVFGLATAFPSGGPPYPEEIVALAKVVSSYGGIYSSHIGSEGAQEEKELSFVKRVAKEADIRVQIFHFYVKGEDNLSMMPKYIAEVENARAQGLDIVANQYPYTAMHHGWSAFFPTWATAGGPAKFAERLQDAAVREKIKHDPDFITWSKEHGGWDGIVMATAAKPENKKYLGMPVSAIAKLRGDADPADTCLALMAGEGGRIQGVFHNQSEENVRMVMRLPWVGFGSDGAVLNLKGSDFAHPRSFASNVRVLGYYVRGQHVLTLEDAVRKMTSLPAQIMGITGRGQIHEGFAADVVLFDPDQVGETNSYEKPNSYPVGVPYVLVNGVVVIDKGMHTGARPGAILYGPGYKHELKSQALSRH
jgi:N-acyl-D-amino-acid deacylase